ncbi:MULTISPECIES: hypothetical protein [unclassified Brevibacillus]|uniref:hypothetical protein n=1 Tax=unclassified Brevibacillus TaxID=2684853 RepID=UPI003566AB48
MRYRKLFHPQKKSPNVYEVAVDNADHKQTEIPEGEYLLFLHGGYDEEVGHVRWFPNTPNQLFKATGGDSGTAYKNVFVSDEIPSITEEKVLDAI